MLNLREIRAAITACGNASESSRQLTRAVLESSIGTQTKEEICKEEQQRIADLKQVHDFLADLERAALRREEKRKPWKTPSPEPSAKRSAPPPKVSSIRQR